MGAELSELNISVPKHLEPAVEYLIISFDDAVLLGDLELLVRTTLHGRGLDENDRRMLRNVLRPVPGIELNSFIERVLSGTKAEIIHAFRSIWVERARQAVVTLFSELLDLAYANFDSPHSSPASWAGDAATQIFESRNHCTELLTNVCEDTYDLVPLENWKAPKLVIMQPLGELPYVEAAAWERLNVKTSAEAVRHFALYCHSRVIVYLRYIIGQAELDWAKRPKPTPALPLESKSGDELPKISKPGKTRRDGNLRPPGHKRRAVIFGALQCELTGRKYCAALDKEKLAIPPEWMEQGCPPTYSAAYLQKKWRQRIQDEKSKYKSKYSATPPAEREFLIQTDRRQIGH